MANSQDSSRAELRSYLNYLYGFEKEDLELEFLPDDEPERSTRLSALRTEIMAGGGPDVFLLSCNVPDWEKSREKIMWSSAPENYGNRQRLFPDVRSAMKNGIFLPLDEYMEKARCLDTSLLHSTVLEAGRTEEGQLVLPITFTLPYAVYNTEDTDGLEDGAVSWEEALSGSSASVCAAYGDMVSTQFPCLLGELADYNREKLLFSREELLETVRQALKLESAVSSGTDGGLLYTQSLNYDEMAYWRPGYYDFNAHHQTTAEDVQLLTAIPNTSGGVTAHIAAYICINRNTRRPEDAFTVLDFFSKTEVQTAKGDWEPRHRESGRSYQSFLLLGSYGIPARNDLMQNVKLPFNFVYPADGSIDPDSDEELIKEYNALRQGVTSARFYGRLDEELQAMFEACMEAETAGEVEEIVSRTYSTMEKILEES